MEWVVMDPRGFILREVGATGVIGILIYPIGIWYVLLDWIWAWTIVGTKYYQKTTHIDLFGIQIRVPKILVGPVGVFLTY